MKKESVEKAIKYSSVSMLTNIMYIMLMCVDILQEEIDKEFRKHSERFHHEKRQAFNRYKKCMLDASVWIEKFGVDQSVWEAVHENTSRFDGFRADANELLRLVLLYVDRSHTEDGFYKIFRYLRSLPENGIFSEEDVAKFEFKRPWILGAGDRVRTDFGDGTVNLNTNKDNWLINMDDGTQRVLKEIQLTQI